jgi:putative colanic acid biosynthesis acetyltransferase WcaF
MTGNGPARGEAIGAPTTHSSAAAAPPSGATEHTNRSNAGESPEAKMRTSAWTTRQKITRVLWWTLGKAVWTLAPALRPWIIRRFGGTVGTGCSLHRTVEIAIPWNIHLGDHVRVGPRALLYSLGPITIGSHTVLDRRAHICAGTHDHADPTFKLLRPPITIGERCLIGLDAYIGPDVTLGDNCTVHPRASVYRSVPAGTELMGNPAKPVETGGSA